MPETRRQRASTLRFIAVRMGLPDLTQAVRKPGISEGFRVTVLYHDGRHPNQIATLLWAHDDAVSLEVIYRGGRNNPILRYAIAPDRYRMFDRALRQTGFDRLDDQPDLPLGGVDLWLVERASGSFIHDVVLSPDLVVEPYAGIVHVVRAHLREAVRAIQPE